MTLLLAKAGRHFGIEKSAHSDPTRVGGRFLPRTEGEADSHNAAVIAPTVCWTS